VTRSSSALPGTVTAHYPTAAAQPLKVHRPAHALPAPPRTSRPCRKSPPHPSCLHSHAPTPTIYPSRGEGSGFALPPATRSALRAEGPRSPGRRLPSRQLPQKSPRHPRLGKGKAQGTRWSDKQGTDLAARLRSLLGEAGSKAKGGRQRAGKQRCRELAAPLGRGDRKAAGEGGCGAPALRRDPPPRAPEPCTAPTRSRAPMKHAAAAAGWCWCQGSQEAQAPASQRRLQKAPSPHGPGTQRHGQPGPAPHGKSLGPSALCCSLKEGFSAWLARKACPPTL